MPSNLRISPEDEHLAKRLVSALVFGWDLIPMATQGQLLHDAAFMKNGAPNATTLPQELLAFINANKPLKLVPTPL
jgi:hypothetical protein